MKELSFLRVGWACSPWLQSVWARVECIPPTWRPATSSRSPALGTATNSTCCSQKGLGRKDPLRTLSEIDSLLNQWRVWLSWECFPVPELLVTLTHFTFFSPVIVSKGVWWWRLKALWLFTQEGFGWILKHKNSNESRPDWLSRFSQKFIGIVPD